MNGAQALLQTLVNCGVEVCFTNPGTSEMHFVAAVDKVPGMRTVLGLFEGVCTGAADGYARMTGKPATTLLHLGPGLGNGLANLHNARRANSPVVNIVGDHATYHLQYDAPLTSDIVSIAKGVSGWIKSCPDAASVPAIAAEAVAASLLPPGQIATLILPADTAWNESTAPVTMRQPPPARTVAEETVAQIARILRSGEATVLVIGGAALTARGQLLAARIAEGCGARVMSQRLIARQARGAGLPIIEQIPYPVPDAVKLLAGTRHLILAGSKEPVGFFAYPNLPSRIAPPDCQIHTLAAEDEAVLAALEALAEAVHAPQHVRHLQPSARPALPDGELTIDKVWRSVAAQMPEASILVDEAVTAAGRAFEWMAGAPPHDTLNSTGGSIGQGIPVATGAAIACPDRRVINMQADGSAMYTLQALWTQARERLDVVTLIFNNRAYRILQGELKRVGAEAPGPKALRMLDLSDPTLDFVKLAEAMGVPAAKVTTTDDLNRRLQDALELRGPALIEVMV